MLKSLELIGFKSFADKTSFDFSPGVTGVVGPNGSGKSNVVDGVKWILGSQSARSLRGKEMTDVIFNGSAGRKAAGFAEATLHFDNSSAFLPTDRIDVSIGRRIWSSGDSEYLINNQTARLKDIKDLLAGSGIGVSAYCIIEQGRVDQILQSNPANRRTVFEEAAGISRFKGRKAEALRKLERVEQNLRRLTDIVDEVEVRLNATRNQATKAAKYRELADELRELWLGLAADDDRRLSHRLASAELALAEQQSKLDDVTDRQNRIESQIQQFDVDIASLEDQIRGVDRHVSDLRQKISSHRTTVRHQSARRREMETELIRLRRQRTIMHYRVAESQNETAHTRGVLADQHRDFETLQISLQQKQIAVENLVAAVKTARADVERLRVQLLEKTRRQAAARSRLDVLQNQLDAGREADATLESRLDRVRNRLEDVETEIARRDERVQAAATAVNDAEEAVQMLLAQRETLQSEERHIRRKIAELREQRSAAKARKTVLEDLELRQEGVGIGVREILERSQSTDLSPWNCIRGSVVDLLDVDLEHAALLEVALGQRAQLILIDELPPLIDYLHQGRRKINGRVGFLSLAEDHPTGRNEPSTRDDLFDRPGVVNRADRLVRPHPNSETLVERLLGDTWIVESLQVAFDLAHGNAAENRFVTLQGELLEPDGALYIGSVRSETAIVSRRSELRRLKNDLIRFDRLVETEERNVAELQQRIDATRESIETARSTLQRSREELAETKNRAAGSHSEYSLLQQQRREIESSLAESADAQTQLKIEENNILASQEALDTELGGLQDQITRLEDKRVTAEEQLHERDHSLASDKLELAKQGERLESLKQAFQRMREDLHLREQQLQESQRRLQHAEHSLRDTTLTILNTNAELAELQLQVEQFSEEADGLSIAKDEARLQRGRLLHQETEIRNLRREISDRRHQAEMQARDAGFQLQSLEERIREEYGLVLKDVVDSGASAIKAYIAERNNVSETDGDAGSIDRTPQSSAETPVPSDTELPDGFDYDGIHQELEDRVNRLRRKIKMMGSVDTDSLANLDELEERFHLLSTQLEDLVEARNALEEIIRRINQESKRLFSETFQAIQAHFQELFRKLFGGGEGDIILEDADDILECGVDIVARPPGKELRSISLLSGGEKTMTAVALLMAIFKTRPSPFCILDEVDAALDEANIDRFINVVKEFQENTQFIVITHRKPTMTVCDVLYGVTMQQSGVSNRMSVRFDDVSENGEFRNPNGSTATDAA